MTPEDNVTPGSEALVVEHMPLVGHIVRETMGRVPSHVDRDDLHLGRTDGPGPGRRRLRPRARRARSPATPPTRIRGAIVDELRSIDWASRSVRRRARELDATRTRLAATLGRPPTDAEVASRCG